jgi:D-serine deaminase-like pyridoxal phosphate-dependent protein
MPVFMIERQFAEELDSVDALGLKRINDEAQVRWLYSFLSKDKRKTYCLYEAESADAIRAAAQRAGIPADVIVEVSQMLKPDGTRTPMQASSTP